MADVGIDVSSGSRANIITTNWCDLPTHAYDVVYVDPPWLYYGDPNKDQAAGKHYRCMSFDELAELPVASLLKPKAIIAMWTTGTKMAEACCLLTEWGCYAAGLDQDEEGRHAHIGPGSAPIVRETDERVPAHRCDDSQGSRAADPDGEHAPERLRTATGRQALGEASDLSRSHRRAVR